MTGTALLTGSSGFIGRHLQPRLSAQGWQVRLMQRPAHDLLNADSLPFLCEGVDLIVHLASYSHVNHADTRLLYDTNVTGTANLLSAACRARVPRLIYVSSILADAHYDQPRTAYGDSKHQAEELLRSAHRRGDIQVCILRPVNVYGPGMKGNLMTLLRLIQRGRLPPLPDFKAGFSLIGVEDLCTAISRAADYLEGTSGAEAGVFPVTDGTLYTLKEVEAAIRRALGKSPGRHATPAWLFYLGALSLEVTGRLLRLRNAPGLRTYRALSRPYTVDDSASRMELGYNPAHSFYQVLPALMADLKQNGRS